MAADMQHLISFWTEALQRPAAPAAPSVASTPPAPARPIAVPRAAGSAASFVQGLDALSMRPGGRLNRAVALADHARRGRAPAPLPLRWYSATSVAEVGARLIADTRSARSLPAEVESTFSRYRQALAVGGTLALPFTADKVAGFLAVYVERWGQKSSSLKSVVDRLELFATHYGFPWLSPEESDSVAAARVALEKANPCERSFAAAVDSEALTRMMRVLDDGASKSNLWALQLAAILALAFGGALRASEPTHALVKDVRVTDEGVYVERWLDKTHKRIMDKRDATSRARALPGSPLCPVARIRAYLSLARLTDRELIFMSRDPRSGLPTAGTAGRAAIYSEYAYKRDFKALAITAKVTDAASLVPRGLRSGGAQAERLSGLGEAALNGKIGWGSRKTQRLYVHENVIGLELDAAARSASRSRR